MAKSYIIEFKIKNPEYQQDNKWAPWASLTSDAVRKQILKVLKNDWGNTYEFREGE